jgi:hypothetical protein
MKNTSKGIHHCLLVIAESYSPNRGIEFLNSAFIYIEKINSLMHISWCKLYGLMPVKREMFPKRS